VPARVRRILLRGLQVAPEARWPSMDALLDELADDPAQRRRRVYFVAGGLGLAALVGVLVHFQGAQKLALCSGAADRLAGLWDAPRREAMRHAFAASSKPYAGFAAEEAARALDLYASDWVAMHDDACQATRVRGDQSEAVMSLRMACLEDRRRELRALTDVLTAADDDTVERAVLAARSLPQVALCADVKALMAVTPPPADAGVQHRIEDQRTHLAEARALLYGGKYAKGLEVAEPVVRAAATLGYRLLSAEALELTGRLRFKSGDYHGADRAWREALWAAEEAGDEELKSSAAMHLADVAVDLRGFADAHDWLRYTEATVRRLGASGERQVSLWVAEALVYFRESRYPEAEEVARKAVGLAEKVLPEGHLERAAAYRTLGDVLKYEQRYAEGLDLLEKARVITEQSLGPDHPDVAAILRKEIDVYSLQRDGERGFALGKKVLALLEKSLPPGHLQIAQTHTNLAESLGLLGRYEDAVAEERLALPTYERLFGPDSENVGVSCTNLGYALMQLGRDDEARRDLERAIAIYEKRLAPDDPDRAEPLLRLGQLALKQHKPREAIPLLERALQLRKNDRDPTEMRAEIERALADARGK
jgi:tetratricopeptide (TPR) repeat protein